jgi:2,3-bisphosphoglycerate-independent phosphoglycerate mutase
MNAGIRGILKLGLLKTEYSIMILPDHPTPIVKRTHTSDPVPFLIYDSKDAVTENGPNIYDEFYPKTNGMFISEGHKLMDYFLSKKD